jgi:hypothetical protein
MHRRHIPPPCEARQRAGTPCAGPKASWSAHPYDEGQRSARGRRTTGLHESAGLSDRMRHSGRSGDTGPPRGLERPWIRTSILDCVRSPSRASTADTAWICRLAGQRQIRQLPDGHALGLQPDVSAPLSAWSASLPSGSVCSSAAGACCPVMDRVRLVKPVTIDRRTSRAFGPAQGADTPMAAPLGSCLPMNIASAAPGVRPVARDGALNRTTPVSAPERSPRWILAH